MNGYLSRLVRRAAGEAPTAQALRPPAWGPLAATSGRFAVVAPPSVDTSTVTPSHAPTPPATAETVLAPRGARDLGPEPTQQRAPAATAEESPVGPRAGVTPRTSDDATGPATGPHGGVRALSEPITAPGTPSRTPHPAAHPTADRRDAAQRRAPAAEPAGPTRGVPTGGAAPGPAGTARPRRAEPAVTASAVCRVEVAPPTPSSTRTSDGTASTRSSGAPPDQATVAGRGVRVPVHRANPQPVARPRADQVPAARNVVQVHIGTIEIQGPPVPAAVEPIPALPPPPTAGPARGAFDEFVGLRTYTPWHW